MASKFDVATARKAFPALAQQQVYMDNAGGTQTLSSVADSIHTYLLSTNVQLGATYPVSATSTRQYNEGYAAAAGYINADVNEVVLGGATTQLFANLATSLYSFFSPGDEIILSLLDHEANIGAWVRMAALLKLSIVWWKGSYDTSKYNPVHAPDNLIPLLTPRTKFVACTHTSNILGSIHDIAALSKTIKTHAPGALFCVDGVAYAPHRAVDVKALGVDFYCFSWYKVYGPHISMLYASSAAQKYMTSQGHYFKGAPETQSLDTKLGHAGSSYELVASIPHIVSYLSPAKETWDAIAAHEEELTKPIIEFLEKDKRVQIVGQPVADKELRVPVISFWVEGWKSEDVVLEVEKRSAYGFRWGHMYTHRLVEGLWGKGDDGAVRISLVHYNTLEEVQGLLKVLGEVLKA
ncbi:PLP-dependent transferase [Pseudovirgaria hyperparasitica]|uniref:PLP-dependent transferase n=1 Tax=Pseudovirgaria hyperparasitica TaxID=470096 RepID=A0A6A6WKJ7_9PEZI|nr:PLP-dependent transferase [Pseudovirgaria hyperparasitica]KAF2762715.1 PLP-dependent transferase [Pseudovirgaria hyperparasitica]